MNIQVEQLAHLAAYAALGVLVWKVKNIYFRTTALVLAFIIFAVNPVRQTVDRSKAQETATFDVIDKVVVEQKSFEQRQAENKLELETKSKEKYNESIK